MENSKDSELHPLGSADRVRVMRRALLCYRKECMAKAYECDEVSQRIQESEKEKQQLQEDHDSLWLAQDGKQTDMDSQVAMLQSKVHRMDWELREKNRQLKEREDEVGVLEKKIRFQQEEAHRSMKEMQEKCSQKMGGPVNQKLTENNQQWSERWTLREREVLAKKNQLLTQFEKKVDTLTTQARAASSELRRKENECANIKTCMAAEMAALAESDEVEAAQLQQEVRCLQQTVKNRESVTADLREKLKREQELLYAVTREHKKMMPKSQADWERRWETREESLAAVAKALEEETQKKVALIKKERDEIVKDILCEKTKVLESSLEYVKQLTVVEAQLNNNEAEWKKKYGELEERLDCEIKAKEDLVEQKKKLLRESAASEERWLEKEAKNKETIQSLISQILHLSEVASLCDSKKAERERLERKLRGHAAKTKKQQEKENMSFSSPLNSVVSL